jgi:hypothetical protein
MKVRNVTLGTLTMLGSGLLMAGQPLFTFTPITATTVTVYSNQQSPTQVKYRVTNMSRTTHRLALASSLPAGFSQVISGQGNCGAIFTLKNQESCTLSIQIIGNRMTSSTSIKPQVCQVNSNGSPSPYLCYQSSSTNAINVNLNTTSAYASLRASTDFIGLFASGINRIITITNDGPDDANALAITALNGTPAGTLVTNDCPNPLPATNTCTITIDPGPTPSSPAGTAPSPNYLSVVGTNTTTLVPGYEVLTYGNIYQEGYIFSVTDSAPDTSSIAGKAATLINLPLTPWYTGSLTTGATSYTDGSTNTLSIIAAQGQGDFAANVCNDYSIDTSGDTPCRSTGTCFNDWYLPAICEIAPTGQNAGCAQNAQTMSQTLTPLLISNTCSGTGCFHTFTYWSSTEYTASQAWWVNINAQPSYEVDGADSKGYPYYVRCARALTR